MSPQATLYFKDTVAPSVLVINTEMYFEQMYLYHVVLSDMHTNELNLISFIGMYAPHRATP